MKKSNQWLIILAIIFVLLLVFFLFWRARRGRLGRWQNLRQQTSVTAPAQTGQPVVDQNLKSLDDAINGLNPSEIEDLSNESLGF